MSDAANPKASRLLPAHASLRHLKLQARDLLKAGEASSLTDAQFTIARSYGFASWPKLKVHVESLQDIGQLKLAIDTNDLDRVKRLMTRNPELHRAPLGYGKDGPLTWVAECRIPWERPGAVRLAMAEWMIEHGSDVHQGGDGPLMRAALGDRVPMMELLVRHGADVNARWHGDYPIIFAACEGVDPVALKWLLDHGANPNCANPDAWHGDSALDFVIGSYGRSADLARCIDILVGVGAVTRYDEPGLLDLLRGDLQRLAARLDADASLVHRRYPKADFGTTGARNLTLRGATLLHVAAEYQLVEAARFLLDRGADVNARAEVDANGVGGQTAMFHAVTQYENGGLPVAQLLLERGADLSIRATVPGHYERDGETIECSALGYAERFPGRASETATVAWLRSKTAGGAEEPTRVYGRSRAEYESLAVDLVHAYASGDRAAMQRIAAYFNVTQDFTWAQLRAELEERLRVLPGGGTGATPLALTDARRLVAQSHGFQSWDDLLSSAPEATA